MGTNYYWHPSGFEICPHCESQTRRLHVGKSSMGWNFSLRIHPDEGINTLDDWRARWKVGAIFDEYGEPVSVENMEATIARKGWDGPLRSHVGYVSSIGYRSESRYGGPTYDLCDYEFS